MTSALGTSCNVLSSQLSKPFGTIAGGVLTFNGLSLIDPAATGGAQPAALARCEASAGTVVFSGLTVGP
jgi:hypothetical protein